MTFTVASETTLSNLISAATERLVLIAPGVTLGLVQAIERQIDRTPRLDVTIILDSDPEVYRLGYGTEEGLRALKALCDRQHLALRAQPGIRIGVLISDGQTMVYSPAPESIEAGSKTDEKPNAILLRGLVVNELARAAGATEETTPANAEIGQKPLTPEMVAAIAKNLDEIPPGKFDITRQTHVFSSQLQYVELTISHYRLTTQTVRVPAHLLGLAGDTEGRWRNRLQPLDQAASRVKIPIVDKYGKFQDTEVDQRYMERLRKKIEDLYFFVVAGFGVVMFKQHQEQFEFDVQALEKNLLAYAKAVRAAVDQKRASVIKTLVTQLLPAVVANPPERYRLHVGTTATDIEAALRSDLEDLITSENLIQDPTVKHVYKGITYQSAQSDEFKEKLNREMERKGVPASRRQNLFRESNAALEKGGLLH